MDSQAWGGGQNSIRNPFGSKGLPFGIAFDVDNVIIGFCCGENPKMSWRWYFRRTHIIDEDVC